MLPEEFLHRMQNMLSQEYPDFLKSYEDSKIQALRINPQKGISAERLKQQFTLSPVPWAKDGYYYGPKEQPGRHPYHDAGCYYIQEASAMAPAAYLKARPGERVLDLCAAPGGKSTQIAADMQGEGILVCNEIHPARAKILSENIERMGIRNAIVTNETPQALVKKFKAYFDRILVDAPCSGEGMFRKNEEACREWSVENVRLCADRQDEILDSAAQMLCPGGCLVYSTCTFAPEENEGSISRFLHRNPDFELSETGKFPGMTCGVPEWTRNPAPGLERTIRMFPHKLRGEGHYAAVLQKKAEGSAARSRKKDCAVQKENIKKENTKKESLQKELKDYFRFQEEALVTKLEGKLIRFGDQLYLAPDQAPALNGLKVLRPGLHLGTLKKNRFEPSHALALTLRPKDVVHSWELSSEENVIHAYLQGQTFPAEGEKGWYLVTADGCSIGWGKLAESVMKNHYPKGLRKRKGGAGSAVNIAVRG